LNSFDAKRKEERRKENPSGDFFILTYIFLYLPFIKITWGISSILTAIRKGMFWHGQWLLNHERAKKHERTRKENKENKEKM